METYATNGRIKNDIYDIYDNAYNIICPYCKRFADFDDMHDGYVTRPMMFCWPICAKMVIKDKTIIDKNDIPKEYLDIFNKNVYDKETNPNEYKFWEGLEIIYFKVTFIKINRIIASPLTYYRPIDFKPVKQHELLDFIASNYNEDIAKKYNYIDISDDSDDENYFGYDESAFSSYDKFNMGLIINTYNITKPDLPEGTPYINYSHDGIYVYLECILDDNYIYVSMCGD